MSTFLVKLGNGLEATFDLVDKELIEKHLWRCDGGYAATGRHQRAHNLILGFIPHDGKTVDHIDRNSLNNRRENLRIATRAQQSVNRGLFKNSTTGISGVTFNEKRNRYAAIWRADGEIKRQYFPLKKHSNAKELAITARKNAEETVEDYASSLWNVNVLKSNLLYLEIDVPETAVEMLALLKPWIDIDALRI
jgi:hypothetical protein